MPERPILSIIIPTLNESSGIQETLQQLLPLRQRNVEIIVVDGGSSDNTIDLAEQFADTVITTEAGRAKQMNRGANIALGEYFLFLHADTQLPINASMCLINAFQRDIIWGYFDIRLSGHHCLFRVIEKMINIRSRLSQIATGDQAIFVRRDQFKKMGGYPDIPLMEDIALSRSLKKVGAPCCFSERVITSSRRWERRGILRTILLMWFLRLKFFFGADPGRLTRWYQ